MLDGLYRYAILWGDPKSEIGTVVAKDAKQARLKALVRFWRIDENYQGLYPEFSVRMKRGPA